ncbi:MAG: xanthine dehydrogenase family protein molybdopterin-binding subunit [Spirochaetaceae bacterium]|nr:MAG: xanthine dehydrogenase family protein molybdopterin-binding subunit [Spirochaetaceae bacterium]
MAKLVKTKIEFEGHIREEEVVVEHDDLAVWAADSPMTHVGTPMPRVDGHARVTGSAEYTYDVRLPGMLWGAIKRSPHPHARVRRIDADHVRSLPGVVDVLTADECGGFSWYGNSALIDRTVRYHGDEVACVIAETEQAAIDAIDAITVDYEVLHHVVDIEAAAEPTAPQIHPDSSPGQNRTREPERYLRGDMNAGRRAAEVTLTARYRTPSAIHASFETHGSAARWESDELTVWDSTQNIFGVRSSLASTLGVPLAKVRVISRYMGGGFGSKNDLGKHTVLAALAARRTGRPVRIMLTREEEFLAAGHRPPVIVDVELGATRDGKLAFIRAHSITSPGAYGSGGFQVCGPFREYYACANVETVQEAVYTNTGPACAFRAPGYVEGTFALESAIDELAALLGMDPLALRIANYTDVNQPRGMRYSQKHLLESYRAGADAIDWDARRAPTARAAEPTQPAAATQPAPKLGTMVRGVGVATQGWGGGGAPPSYAIVRLNPDATFDVLTGTHDLGTGTKTVMTQIAAQELGVPMDRVRVTIGDTLTCPYSLLSAGSLTVPSVGPTVRAAAADARAQILDIAGSLLDTDAAQLSIAGGVISSTSSPDRCVTIEDVARKIGNYMVIGKGARGPNPSEVSVNTFGAQFVEVEVDTVTGAVRVLRVIAAHEFGRVINPLTLSSQIEGGVFQATGFAVMEERIMDRSTGRFVNANLSEYRLPTIADVPHVQSLFIGPPDEASNNTGAKGAGEPPIIPTAAAIANAVSDAIGVRIRELPLTRERVLRAIAAREGR